MAEQPDAGCPYHDEPLEGDELCPRCGIPPGGYAMACPVSDCRVYFVSDTREGCIAQANDLKMVERRALAERDACNTVLMEERKRLLREEREACAKIVDESMFRADCVKAIRARNQEPDDA